MVWTIEYAEYPLPWLLNKTGLMKQYGHSYLVLKDPAQNIVSELHGLCYDPDQGRYKPVSLASIFNGLVREIHPRLNFENSILAVGAGWGPSPLTQKHAPACHVLCQGNADEVLPRWIKGMETGLAVNRAQIKYIPVALTGEAVNCHTVSHMLTATITDHKPACLYKSPGKDTSITDKITPHFRAAATSEGRTESADNPTFLINRIKDLSRRLMQPNSFIEDLVENNAHSQSATKPQQP